MTHLFTRFLPGLLIAALAAGGGVAVTTIAHAQTPPMMHGGPGMQGRHMMMEVERLRTSLKLNASQAAAWDRAVEQMKPPTDLRDKAKAQHERMASMLDDPAFDPRKWAADMDSVEAERRAKMTSVRDAWFAVYDSLNPVQRGQAREFLRSHLSRSHGMRERMGWMHRDGDGPKPPMAPPPPAAPR